MADKGNRTLFFVDQLRRAGVRVFGEHSRSEDLQAYCFQGHDKKSASLYIQKQTGAFYCHGCGVHGANWNALRAYIDVEPLDEQDLPSRLQVMAARIKKRRRQEKFEMAIPWGTRPWTGNWRAIEEYTLRAVEASKWFDPQFHCFRIMLPVKMYGKLEGWTARRLDDPNDEERGETPYKNAPNMSSRDLLYPLDVTAQMRRRTVVMVEGPYDALRLLNYNIPTVAILGTKNYLPENKIHLLNIGVQRVIVAMDEDRGGEEARLDIAMDLRTYFDVEHFRAPEDKDPGNMPFLYLERLAAMAR